MNTTVDQLERYVKELGEAHRHADGLLRVVRSGGQAELTDSQEARISEHGERLVEAFLGCAEGKP